MCIRDRKKKLLAKGLTPRSTYNALVREEADSSGRMGALTASIAQRRSSLLELEKEELRLTAARREEAAGEFNATSIQIPDVEERLRASEDILARSDVRSPVDGIVVKLAKNTVGSTARPGETLVEILPTNSGLIIESKILPQDIDVVRPGQTASVRFVALNTRTTPDVEANVTYVSADRLVDQQTQQPYYVARLTLSEDLPPPLTREQLYPGMPVETFISTGDRTFFEYLVKPLADSFNRAFREN
jgi:HlyD family secretion protein